MKLINEQEVFDTWAPMLEAETGVNESTKLGWMSRYCHYHSLNEAFTYPQAGLLNIPGMGNVQPAGNAAGGAGLFYGNSTSGSGDKFPSLLPLAIQVAGKTIGFDIVSVIPMNGPSGVLTYLDYVYAGGKNPAGAPPYAGYGAAGTGNPGINSPYGEKPLIFKVRTAVAAGTLTVGAEYYITLTAGATSVVKPTVKVTYVGKSRIDGSSIFRVVGEGTLQVSGFGGGGPFLAGATHSVALYETINGAGSNIYADNYTTIAHTVGANVAVELVKALEDHIQGFTGAGPNDDGDWNGNYVDGTVAYEPMRRGVGEEQYYRTMGLQAFTKFVEAQTYQVAATITTEQIQDMNRQYGIDVVSMVENALVNDISQAINKHILSRAFALGYQNHYDANQAENVNLNLQLSSTVLAATSTANYIGKDSTPVNWTNNIPAYADFGGFENQDTTHSRIFANVLAAGNLVAQRGRRGAANFVVCNLQIATALQKNAQYSFAPMANTINQNNGSLYPVGTIAGMTVYVDPNMQWNDRRVLIGRKGADEEPGLKFMPYLMAESIQTIAEGSMSPKIAVKSRYALVEAGFHPQTQYCTIWVAGPVI
jgi:hypothetical protein